LKKNDNGKSFRQVKKGIIIFVLYPVSLYCVRAQDISKLPDKHAVKLTVEIQTTVPVESGKDPAPVWTETKRISGTLVGTAVLRRIKDIASIHGSWSELFQHNNVPVFTANSEYAQKDKNDYSKNDFKWRYPLKVSIDRTEMDYISFKEGGKYVEKYVKISEFKAEGKNEAEAFSIKFVPYHPTKTVAPLIPHYVLVISVQKYMNRISDSPEGNGHSLKWDYSAEQLKPTGNPLYLTVTGTLTEGNPDKNVKPLLVEAKELNNYFLNPSAVSLNLNLNGSSYEENNGKRHRIINVTIELKPIRNVLQTPFPNI
jgi:hypothetical protein